MCAGMEERNGLSTWNFVGIPHTLPSKFLKDCSVPSQMASLCIWRYMRSIYVCSIFSLSCCFHLMYTIDPSDIRTSLISGQQHWMLRSVIMSMEDLLPKEVDSSNQLPACLKMLFLVKIPVAMFPQTLTPVSYATKITSSLAFKQLVECVGIFCDCSEHLLAFVPSF